MSNVLIREFRFPDDYRSALKLWEDMEKGVHVGPSDSPDEIQKKMERDPDLFLVAELDGQIVGTVIGGFDGRRGTVYHLSVAAPHRTLGLATQLLNVLEVKLRLKGCMKCYLLVNADNLDAFSFYEHRGWKRTDNVIFSKEF